MPTSTLISSGHLSAAMHTFILYPVDFWDKMHCFCRRRSIIGRVESSLERIFNNRVLCDSICMRTVVCVYRSITKQNAQTVLPSPHSHFSPCLPSACVLYKKRESRRVQLINSGSPMHFDPPAISHTPLILCATSGVDMLTQQGTGLSQACQLERLVRALLSPVAMPGLRHYLQITEE